MRDELEAYGLTRFVGEDRIFPTLPTAPAAYRAWCGENEGGGGGRHPADGYPGQDLSGRHMIPEKTEASAAANLMGKRLIRHPRPDRTATWITPECHVPMVGASTPASTWVTATASPPG